MQRFPTEATIVRLKRGATRAQQHFAQNGVLFLTPFARFARIIVKQVRSRMPKGPSIKSHQMPFGKAFGMLSGFRRYGAFPFGTFPPPHLSGRFGNISLVRPMFGFLTTVIYVYVLRMSSAIVEIVSGAVTGAFCPWMFWGWVAGLGQLGWWGGRVW